MGKCIGEWNGHNIFEPEYDKWREHEQCSSLESYGVAYKFHRWLAYNGLDYDDEEVDDTFNNLSGCRDGNRWDIHENYKLWDSDGMEISFLYVVNGNLWAEIVKDNSWYGDIEIENV